LKKIALAAALAAGFAGMAQAQSSVTVFGVVDLGVTHTTASGNGSLDQLSTDQNTSSRLGFRGTEDLGGGMKASFWLEAAITPDSGVGGSTSVDNKSSANPGALTFGRRSTLELSGSMGEIRLGRDYVPTFTNLTVAHHPFGTNGVGNAGQLFYPVAAGGTTARTNVRASNGINYFSPVMNGFQLNAMYAMGEQLSNAGATKNDGNYAGARLSYGNGPLNMAYASGKTNYATGNYTQSNFAANYVLGNAKLMYLWGENKVGTTKTTSNMVGVQYKVSATGEVRAGYTALKATGQAASVGDANQIAVGYVHNLSKRTALYTTYSTVENKGAGKQFVVGGGQAIVTPGGKSTGLDLGIRHSF